MVVHKESLLIDWKNGAYHLTKEKERLKQAFEQLQMTHADLMEDHKRLSSSKKTPSLSKTWIRSG
jgi:hypothetical protein